MRIILNQKYGLGNQMFQYAAGLYFAKMYGATLEIIREDFSTASSLGHPRPFLLDRLNISTPARERTLVDRLLRSESRLVVCLTGPIRRICQSYSIDPRFTILGDFQPSLPIPTRARRVYLGGFFQVHQYAQAMEPQLRKEFTFREPPSRRNLETLQRIQDAKCPVSMHFRRGDYVSAWKGQNLLPFIYYENAMAAIREVCPDPTFFVFSDDIESVRKDCRDLKSAIFVDNNSESVPHEDLRLISACRHHIVANSTLSWWGAWLDPRPEKAVIVPIPWYTTHPHPNLFPASWRQIPSQNAKTGARQT
ncbi:MAG TPA: alpha-1,2-fucosyltransferase [Acidobacteriaceae bacterium]|nr:alpha-1,2-fucosyltransferase [Acidobacteriaceae bacterium]